MRAFHFIPLLLLITVSMTTDAITCTPGICDTVKCSVASAENCAGENKLYKPNGGFCGCCGLCVMIIEENGSCFDQLLGFGGPPPSSQCVEGTVCINNICKRQALNANA